MTNAAANLAFFLLDKTGSVLGKWNGKLSASEQRALFGTFMGKGRLYINGDDETVEHYVKVCFGLDSDCTKSATWAQLERNQV